MLPLAPARLSTTTLCASDSESGVATCRATKSSPPPGPDATMTLIGLLGHALPCAAPYGVEIETATASVAALILIRNVRFISRIHIVLNLEIGSRSCFALPKGPG